MQDTPAAIRHYILRAPKLGPFLRLSDDAASPDVHRYRKEVIKVGSYVHPTTGQPFTVTPETLAHWTLTFQEMSENGVAVTVPLGHQNEDNPEKNLGIVEDLFVDGDGLVGVFALVGDEARTLVNANDVSVYVPADWTDGRGNVYHIPIRHIALTPVPVIPGLGKWEALAASLVLQEDGGIPDNMLIKDMERRAALAAGGTLELSESEKSSPLVRDAVRRAAERRATETKWRQ